MSKKHNKRKKHSKRYTMSSGQETQLANFIYGFISMHKINRVETFFDIDSDSEKVIVRENPFINLTVLVRIRLIYLIFAIELLLKYHIIQQSDNNIFELFHGENGHNLLTLYRKTDANFKEKLKSAYNEYLDKFNIKNENRITDVEVLIDQNKNAFQGLRYSFFTEINHKSGELISINIPCLYAFFDALYVLSDLPDKKGISIDDFEILEQNAISAPFQ